MNPRSLKASAQPRCLCIRREPRAPEVVVSKDFEVLAAGKLSGLCQIEIEDINTRRDLGLFHLFARSLRQDGPRSKRNNCYDRENYFRQARTRKGCGAPLLLICHDSPPLPAALESRNCLATGGEAAALNPNLSSDQGAATKCFRSLPAVEISAFPSRLALAAFVVAPYFRACVVSRTPLVL